MGCYTAQNLTGFDFDPLWNITQQIYLACPNSSLLFQPGTGIIRLTNKACEDIVGSGWEQYPTNAIVSRTTLWKLPLIQLIGLFPRPPLGLGAEAFVIIHLLGDPIDTIWSLLHKLATCQSRAEKFKSSLAPIAVATPDTEWKALALIAVSYDEWGQGEPAVEALLRVLRVAADTEDPEERRRLFENMRAKYQTTAKALAADRSTKFLPVILAQGLFIISIVIAFAKVSAVPPDPSDFINLESHNIAYSALYFWVIPAVFLSSVIGASQTERAIPHILEQLTGEGLVLPSNFLGSKDWRVVRGGVYSWQPGKWEGISNGNWETRFLGLVSFFFVFTGVITACLLSGWTPPDGWGCRHIGQIAIFMTWVVSAGLDTFLESLSLARRFWCIFAKDTITACGIIIGFVYIHIGVYNRCSCWTKGGRTGLALPQEPSIASTLRDRIHTIYPAITYGCIGLQTVIFVAIGFWYSSAFRVFLQRDDGESNLSSLRLANPVVWWPRFKNAILGRLPRASELIRRTTNEVEADLQPGESQALMHEPDSGSGHISNNEEGGAPPGSQGARGDSSSTQISPLGSGEVQEDTTSIDGPPPDGQESRRSAANSQRLQDDELEQATNFHLYTLWWRHVGDGS